MAPERTRRKLRLGLFMEGLRKRADLTPDRAAKIVETSRPTIARMELGQQSPGLHLFYAILGVYGASVEEREEAIKLWRAAKQDTTVIEHAADLGPKYVAFLRDESEATVERTINYVALPGLLQTTGYAAGLDQINRPLATAENWERRSAGERTARQRLLSGPEPLRLHAVLSEAALLCQVGGPVVMAEQLRHLLAVGSQANVTIQVVPLAAGAFGTMNSPVTVLEYDDDPENPYTVYLEYAAGGETIDRQRDVSRFVTLFEDVCAVALPPEDSAELIKARLDTLEDGSELAQEQLQR